VAQATPIARRAERAATTSPPYTALRKLARLRAKAGVEDQLVIDLLAAQTHIVLSDYRSSDELIELVESRLQDLEANSEVAQMITASLAFTRAMMVILDEPERALVLMEEAGAVYFRLGSMWKLGAVECNRAIALVTLGRPDEAISALDAAVEYSTAEPPDAVHLGHRLRAIEVNRSAAMGQLHIEDPVRALLAARTAAVAAEDMLNVGRVDLSLAQTYLTRQRFGSQLRAATSAQRSFTQLGMQNDATLSSILAARALVGLGRYEGVEEYLVALMNAVPDPDSERPPWWHDAGEALSAVRRALDPQAAMTMKTDLSPLNRHPPILGLITRMNAMLDDAFERIMRGEFAPPPSELAEVMEQIRAVRVPEAIRIAEVIEQMITAISTGSEMPEISDEHDAALQLAGMSREQAVDSVRAANQIHSSDVATQLAIALGEVADHQLTFAAQESQADRSALHVSAARSLASALQLSVVTGSPDVTFELLESGRRDLSEWTHSVGEGVLPFDAVVAASGDALAREGEHGNDPLAVPGLISVRGVSALQTARPRRVVRYDADALRRGLAGESSIWLSLRLVGQDLVWAYLSEDGTKAGVRNLAEDFELAMARHALAVPVPLAIHRGIAGADALPWMVHLVAVAVTAAGPLVRRADVVGSCLEALPPAVARRTREFIEAGGTDEDIYRVIADSVLPPSLMARLPDVDRLLVSLPPELSTLPLPLLAAQDGRAIGEDVLITLAPPSSLAQTVVSRPVVASARRELIAVVDPTDDLAYATAGGNDALAGWARAAGNGHVATRRNLLQRLERASAGGDFALSFVGHVRPGVPTRPGRSALVLAPAEAGADPEHLGSGDLRGAAHGARQVYLGGCESTGFGTGYEWASVAGAFLASGADTVLAHAWPILDSPDAAAVDGVVIDLLAREGLSAHALLALQRRWIADWCQDPTSAIPPHHWAGLSAVGRLPV
jgi:tetratricopeptide (TPR) repeat protein